MSICGLSLLAIALRPLGAETCLLSFLRERYIRSVFLFSHHPSFLYIFSNSFGSFFNRCIDDDDDDDNYDRWSMKALACFAFERFAWRATQGEESTLLLPRLRKVSQKSGNDFFLYHWFRRGEKLTGIVEWVRDAGHVRRLPWPSNSLLSQFVLLIECVK